MTDALPVRPTSTQPTRLEPAPPAPPPRQILARLLGAGWGVVAWICALAFFLPVLWMVLTAFKTESKAATWPPHFIFKPTFSEFTSIFSNNGFGITSYLEHSAQATIGSTFLVLLLAIPAAYALSIRTVDKWRDALFFFISTKMLPIVAAIMPLYILSKDLHLLDRVWVLVLLYASMNMPLAVWMLRSFFLEVPTELLEAARLDGAGLRQELVDVLLPVVAPGVAATGLICVIFAWNELFLATNLTATNAGTMPTFLAAVPTEGLFWAKLAAEATIASLPVIIIGWVAQRQLVRGLSMGAIK
jgi:sorbitol/mannitol transport system permease protein